MNFKSQLLFYMKLNKISASELSRRSGVSKQSISNWLAGIEPSSFNHVKAVAKVLEVSLDDLVFGGDPRHPKNSIQKSGIFSTELYAFIGFDGYFKDVNTRLPQMLGWTTEEFLRRPAIEFVHAGDRIRTRVKLSSSPLERDLVNVFDHRLVAKTGEIKWFRWSVLISMQDQIAFGVCKDVSNEYGFERDERSVFSCHYILQDVIHTFSTGPFGRGVKVDLRIESDVIISCYKHQFSSTVLSLLHQLSIQGGLQNRRDITIRVHKEETCTKIEFALAVEEKKMILSKEKIEIPTNWLTNNKAHLTSSHPSRDVELTIVSL